MPKAKCLVLKYSDGNVEHGGGEARVIRCNNHLELVNDYQDHDGYIDSMGLPSMLNMDRGLWIFEGERKPPCDEEWPEYTGDYRRPTARELSDLVYLVNDWAPLDDTHTN